MQFATEKYDYMLHLISIIMLSMVGIVLVLLYEVRHQKEPLFFAVSPTGQQLTLTANDEPNLMPATLLRWANKAAVAAYTFGFVDYDKKLAIARQYFTDAGWADYQASIAKVLSTITQNQLFVTSVAAAPPVISNQGYLPGHGYAWRVQMPFLVSYQSAEQIERKQYLVFITIVKVPTWINPEGVGIDAFVMS